MTPFSFGHFVKMAIAAQQNPAAPSAPAKQNNQPTSSPAAAQPPIVPIQPRPTQEQWEIDEGTAPAVNSWSPQWQGTHEWMMPSSDLRVDSAKRDAINNHPQDVPPVRVPYPIRGAGRTGAIPSLSPSIYKRLSNFGYPSSNH
ncbi:hypothetical protein EBZ39_16545 [bacterium]|nr:hypothetical protein [bacterium]